MRERRRTRNYTASVNKGNQKAVPSTPASERTAGMGAQAKKKGPAKGGKGGRKKQAGEAAPSWALEQLALEQNAGDAEADSLPKSASEALEAVASSSPEALAALLAQWGASDLELATQAAGQGALARRRHQRHQRVDRQLLAALEPRQADGRLVARVWGLVLLAQQVDHRAQRRQRDHRADQRDQAAERT